VHQDPYVRIGRAKLFIFDLDGTVYAETEHFEAYARELASFVPEARREAFLEDAHRALLHDGPSFYGHAFSRDTGERVDVAEEDRPDRAYLHVDDPWGLLQVVAIRHGIGPRERDEAFLRTRDYMAGPFPMQPLGGLREAIEAIRARGGHVVLATNSPEPDSRAILRKLNLEDVIEDFVFRAVKPYRTEEHFRRWLAKYGVAPERAVSIGDHYRNEMRPAIRLGMLTIYIDRYIGRDRPDVTLRLAHPGELGDVLMTCLRRAEEAEA